MTSLNSSSNVHVRGVSHEAFRSAVLAGAHKNGLEPVASTPDNAADPSLRRLIVHASATWHALSDPGWLESRDLLSPAWRDVEWAAHLSRALRQPALALFTWEGEAALVARRFEAGKEVARLALLEDAQRDARGRAWAPSRALDPWITPAKRRTMHGKLVLARLEGEDLEADHVFVPLEDSVPALARAIGLPRPWLAVDEFDPTVGDELWLFRPAPTKTTRRPKLVPPVLPNGARLAKSSEHAEALASYAGRDVLVGWLGFRELASSDEFSPVARVLPTVLAATVPAHGLRVRVTSAGRRQVLPQAFLRTSRVSTKALERGGLVELFDGDPNQRVGTRVWVQHEPGAGVPFSIGWSIPLDASAQRPASRALDDAIHEAAMSSVSLGGLVTAQGSGLAPGDPLPYETMSGIAGRHRDAAWWASHVRTPGWRVLLPPEARLEGKPPKDVDVVSFFTGVKLARVDTPSANTMKSLTALERFLLPSLG